MIYYLYCLIYTYKKRLKGMREENIKEIKIDAMSVQMLSFTVVILQCNYR